MKLTKRERLAKAISFVIGMPMDAAHIYPARGYYRQKRADVQAWTGSVELTPGHPGRGAWSIGSWETISDALRDGFVIYDDRGDARAYSSFNVVPINSETGEKIGNGMGHWLPSGRRALQSEGG